MLEKRRQQGNLTFTQQIQELNFSITFPLTAIYVEGKQSLK